MRTNTIEIEEVLRQIGEGRTHIEKQMERLARLEQVGDDTSEARHLLARLQEGQQGYLDQLERLEQNSGLARA